MTMTKHQLEVAVAGFDDTGATLTRLKRTRPDLFDPLWWRKVLRDRLGGTKLEDLTG